MNAPDDDLEAIADINDFHGNVGTRDRRGSKYGSGFKGRPGKLRRIFSAAKTHSARRQKRKMTAPASDTGSLS
jgi:hypothetical protein